jgi:hypothetical protein
MQARKDDKKRKFRFPQRIDRHACGWSMVRLYTPLDEQAAIHFLNVL